LTFYVLRATLNAGGDFVHTRINEIVKKSGLTKTDFAKRLGLSQPFVSRICNGESTPSDRTISDICREFGCDDV
jgi:transcriptional regulator with XRE-family HTH domain